MNTIGMVMNMDSPQSRLYLPAAHLLTKTNEEDPVAYYFNRFTGSAYRRRLRLAIDMLGDRRYDSLLEVGFGSGILLPELARHAKLLYGVETHDRINAVQRMLEAEGVSADLRQGSILELGFDARSFDAVVCLSVLEHMNADQLSVAVSELKRVMRSGGILVAGFPVRNLITDFFYRIVGFSPRDIHPSSHRDILREMKRHFTDIRLAIWPSVLPLDLSFYVVCKCIG